jgi:ubiquinone/menaquinone biosynthesis C-methylase UbiE
VRPVRFVHAPVERLDEAGLSGPFDVVFAAYLLRNAADPDAVLATAHRLLTPYGRLGVHEYALSGRASHRAVWNAVCGGLVLPVATLLGDGPLYRHLRRSVLEFDTAAALGRRVLLAGFERVRVLPLPGWQTGITHTVVARRPADPPDTDPGSVVGEPHGFGRPASQEDPR